MPVAFVVIKAVPGQEHEVYKALQAVPGLVEIHPLFGEYDLITKVEGADLDALVRLVLNHVRTVPGLLRTKTFVGTKF